jgi:nucleoid-associated protein YgaU
MLSAAAAVEAAAAAAMEAAAAAVEAAVEAAAAAVQAAAAAVEAAAVVFVERKRDSKDMWLTCQCATRVSRLGSILTSFCSSGSSSGGNCDNFSRRSRTAGTAKTCG